MKSSTTIKKNFMRAGRNQQGFTLMETLISMVILTVGIFGLIKTASSVIYHQDNSRLITEATMITSNKIEDIKGLATNEPTGGAFGFDYLVTDYLTDEVYSRISALNYRKIEPPGALPQVGFQTTTDLQVYLPGADEDFDSPVSIKMLELVVKTEWKDSRGITKDIVMASVLNRRQFIE